jgi:hypothetical protein
MHDVRDAWRALRATPVISALAVVSLALGIGPRHRESPLRRHAARSMGVHAGGRHTARHMWCRGMASGAPRGTD